MIVDDASEPADASTDDHRIIDDRPQRDASSMDAAVDTSLDDALDDRPAVESAAPDAASRDASDDGQAAGPRVDRSMPQLYSVQFRPSEADPAATMADALQSAQLDTRVAPLGRLVVYLHGAGAPTNCGSIEHGRLLASWGFHVLQPCYSSNYGVSNCGADIYGCRLEAFEGVDHHRFINVTPPDSIERRVVRALELLQRRNPVGDWRYYLDGDRPRWSAIVISGISHGASTAGVIAQVRPVERAVMLSGPLDSGQAWLSRDGMTATSRLWGFSHTMDSQHAGHLAAFMALRLPGSPMSVDIGSAPWSGSHRLISSAMTSDGHGATQAGGSSPRDAMGRYRFEPAWRLMYGAR